MNVLQEYFRLLLLASLAVVILPENRQRTQRNDLEDLSRKQECPKLRFRRKGCSYRYECKEECKERKDCKTTYQYKCKEYKKQVCKNVWQNQCRGKRRSRRSLRRRPYWLDRNNIEVIYNSQDFPLEPSDVPFADTGIDAGATYDFANTPKSRSCWKRVRKCEWKKYKTSCSNVPSTECKPGTIKDCKRRCKNRWYCDQCPTTSKPKPKPTKPTKPTGPPRPQPTRPTPSKPGPPAPPPPGAFIGPPGVPIKQDSLSSIIDARQGRQVKKRLP